MLWIGIMILGSNIANKKRHISLHHLTMYIYNDIMNMIFILTACNSMVRLYDIKTGIVWLCIESHTHFHMELHVIMTLNTNWWYTHTHKRAYKRRVWISISASQIPDKYHTHKHTHLNARSTQPSPNQSLSNRFLNVTRIDWSNWNLWHPSIK